MTKLARLKEEVRSTASPSASGAPEKRAAPKVSYELEDGCRITELPSIEQLCQSFGTTSPEFARCELTRLISNFPEYSRGQSTNAALAMIDALRPTNEIEFCLAMQMYATHVAATEMLGQASKSEFAGNMAVKLLRTFTAQTEALAKLRRGGEQTVRVEHVHVHSGGQAVVGNVTNVPLGGGRSNEIAGQPHAATDPRALAFATGSPVWGEDPNRESLPVADCKREKPVPNARRGTR
jgi:hypothetical protein